MAPDNYSRILIAIGIQGRAVCSKLACLWLLPKIFKGIR